MQRRTIVAVSMFVVVGGAAAWKLTRKDPHARKLSQTTRPAGAPTLVAAEIDELEVTEPGKPTVVLKKSGDEWRLLSPTEDRADQANVKAALDTLEKTKWKEIVAESPSSYEKLQVTDEQVVRVVPKRGGQPIATLLLGKGQNVRLEGSPQVWLVSDLNRFALARDPKMWRDREIIKVEREKVRAVEVIWQSGAKLVVNREPPDKWALAEGQALVGGALDETVPNAILGGLVNLSAIDFADGTTPQAAGLNAPRATLTLVLEDGARRSLLVGNDDGQDVFVKRPDAPRIWKLRKVSVEAWLKPPLQWRDKQLAKVEAKDVKKLEVVKTTDQGTEKIVLERADESWKAVAPADLAKEFDPSKVAGLAGAFANLRASSIAELAAPAAKKAFARPAAVVTVTTTDGATLTLTIGAQDEKMHYVRVSGRNEIFLLPDFTAARFLKGVADFKKSAPAGAERPELMGLPGHPQHPGH